MQLDVEDTRVHKEPPDANDVICLVMRLMADEALCQPPLLVFAAAFSHSARAVFDQMNVVAGTISLAVLSFALACCACFQPYDSCSCWSLLHLS